MSEGRREGEGGRHGVSEGRRNGGREVRTYIYKYAHTYGHLYCKYSYSSPTHTLETDQCLHSYSNKVICMNGNTQIAT